MPRIACCRIPDLPLSAALRADPELKGRPLAIASGPGPRAELVSVSPEAGQKGIRRLDRVAQARTLCSELCVKVASPALENAARQALLDAALSCAPRAALAAPLSGSFAAEAVVFAEASGMEAVFQSERGFATALLERVRRLGFGLGCGPWVTVASSQLVARVAARRFAIRHPEGDRVELLSPRSERAFLASLPLDLLDPGDTVQAALTRFGVRTVRDLLQLPRRALGTRLGPEVLELIACARGEASEAPLPCPTEDRRVEALDLEFAIERLEPLNFVIQGLLSRLLERLEARQLACGEILLRLDLEGGGRDARRIGLAAPSLDLRSLVRLVGHALEKHPPEAPVVGVAVETQGQPLQTDQLDLFRPAGPAPDSLGRTLARLELLCGGGRVGSPREANDHRPHRFEIEPFESRATVRSRKAQCPESGAHPPTAVLAVRALRPPVAATVRLSGSVPDWIRSGVAHGRVLHLSGPWRITGGWWSPESRFAYDYFDVHTSDGTISRLRFDHISGAWHIDAVYD